MLLFNKFAYNQIIAFGAFLDQFDDFTINAGAGVALAGQISVHQIEVPNLNPDLGDTLFIGIERDGTAGNPNDTATFNAIIRQIKMKALVWRRGSSI